MTGKLESELLKLCAEVSDLKEQLSKSVLKEVMNVELSKMEVNMHGGEAE